MKKFKDADISHLPEELQEVLRCIVPEDALLEQIVVHKVTPTDDGKDAKPKHISIHHPTGLFSNDTDSCSPFDCDDCSNCPIEKLAKVNIIEPMNKVAVNFTGLTNYVNLNGNVPLDLRDKAIDTVIDIIDGANEILAILEGGI